MVSGYPTRARLPRLAALLCVALLLGLAPRAAQASTAPADAALAHLREVMDRSTSFSVYSDKYAVANNFAPSGWMGDIGDVSFDEGATSTFHAGGNAIRISYTPAGGQGWAGIYWQHPIGNWGQIAGAGFNLSGATRLSFWARGAVGGERAEFKVGGIGGAAPDSLQPARSTGVLTLDTTWRLYTIDLTGANLSYVIGGFVWVTNRTLNPAGATIYLDDIRFDGYTNKLRLLESYVSLPSWVPPRPLASYRNFYVYQDKDAPANGYVVSPSRNGYYDTGWMGDYGDISLDSGDTSGPHSGATAYRIRYSAAATQGQRWAGIYWQAPAYNWGDRTGGYDLTGAARLSFWARGAAGGEKIQALLGGITGAYYDSVQPARTSGLLTLSTTWQRYTIDLTGANLSRVSGGFAWTATQADNPAGATFYLDDVRYESAASPAGDTYIPPGFDTDSYTMQAAHTYDNALALLAFLASGQPADLARAKLLADSLVWAQRHDEIGDGRLRNVYYADELAASDAYGGVARHNYDLYGNGTTTGNAAWAMLALLNYYQRCGGADARDAALRLGQWIVANTYSTSGAGGYTGGVQGWEPSPQVNTYKSTEHNLDVYVAFMKLYEVTGDATWRARAMHAKQFLVAMWNASAGYFYTGTRPDGVTINSDALPLDVNTWGFLSLGEVATYGRALSYARAHHYASDSSSGTTFTGFDFNTDADGIWWEGTGQMVTALWTQYYFSSGSTQSWSYTNAVTFRDQLRRAQTLVPHANGTGMVAASRDALTTGFDLPTGGPWYYYNRLHIGATAWFVFSELQYNPFWGIAATTAIPYQGQYQ